MFEGFETKMRKTPSNLGFGEMCQILLWFDPFDAGREAPHISRNSSSGPG